MVTGSCYFLTGESTGLMIDYGMFQGKAEEMDWNSVKPDIDFDKLTAVVLTHAHLAHWLRAQQLCQSLNEVLFETL